MNYLERVCKLVDLYVDQNGCDQEMTSEEFKQWVTQNGETSASPSDICFNRCNKGLGEFQYGHFCLVYNLQTKTYRLVGSSYDYSGPVWAYANMNKRKIVGNWKNGKFEWVK